MKTHDTVTGRVVEALPNTQFRVELSDGRIVRAYLAGKMKMNYIKVIVGDEVRLVLDTQGENNRIVRRD